MSTKTALPKLSPLAQRVLSATVLGGAILAIYIFFKMKGLFWVVFPFVFILIFEGTRLLFHSQSRWFKNTLFVIYSITFALACKVSFSLSLFWIYLCLVSLTVYLFFRPPLPHPEHPEHPEYSKHPEHPEYPEQPEHPEHLKHPKPKDLKAKVTLSKATLETIALAVLGGLYLCFCPYLIFAILFQSQGGDRWFLTLLCIVFAGDIGAYFSGQWWGKRHKLFPFISPSKSVAGALGGLFASLLTGVVLYKFLLLKETVQINLVFWLGFVLLLAVFAQIGDYFESLIKRRAQSKDSGNILPGHGGLLDRIDGLLFSAPLLYALLDYLKLL